MYILNKIRCLSSLVIILLILSGCGMPSEVVKPAKEIPTRITEMQKTIDGDIAKYKKLQKTGDFKFFEVYAKRERWEDNFQQANAKLTKANAINSKKILPLLKENSRDKTHQLRVQTKLVNQQFAGIRKLLKVPYKRMTFLKEVKKMAPEWIKTADKQMTNLDKIVTELHPFVAKARTDHPSRIKDINKKFAPLLKVQTDSKSALKTAHKEFSLHKAEEIADYAKLGDGIKIIGANLIKMTADDKTFRAKIGELYRSYSKILTDQRIEYYVQIGRTSWDGYSDYDTDEDYSYPAKKVSEETYTYFTSVASMENVATWGIGWGNSPVVEVSTDYWNKLGIQWKSGWPNGHDEAGYWVNDIFPKAYHKYILIEGTEKKETGWIEVDPEDYEEYYDDIGQEIVSKPYGFFEEEKLEESAPPGMSLVGNPAYGKWVTNPTTGVRSWSFLEMYGVYSLLGGGSSHNYRHNDWNHYNSGYRGKGTGYYGRDKKNPKYGTAGSRTLASPRMQKTSFAKSGGLKSAHSSVRGAGSRSRNRGSGKGK